MDGKEDLIIKRSDRKNVDSIKQISKIMFSADDNWRDALSNLSEGLRQERQDYTSTRMTEGQE